jgi:hypothetical protein
MAVMPRSTVLVGVLLATSVGSSGCSGPTDPSVLAEKRLRAMLAADHVLCFPETPWTLHVKDVEQLSLTEILLKQKNASGEIEYVTWARVGQLSVDVKRNTLLLRVNAGKTLAMNGTRSSFDNKIFDLPLPDHFLR